MKFLLDVHMPMALKFFLQWKGFETIHVKEVLEGVRSSDNDIADFADANKLVLITKDQDFKNSYFIRKSPAKLIRVVLGNCTNEVLISSFEQHLGTIATFEDDQFYGEIGSGSVIVFSKPG